MIEGYSDRMLRAPRFVREGVSGCPTASLHEGRGPIPDAALITVRIADTQGRPEDERERPVGPQARPGGRSGVSEASNSREDEGADAPSQE